ncbi:hypothetical protein EJ02DRAFT_31955 [Clathrospora elynae]|uniref:Uncharacterized protein n=1 Tax=Clathrospora elynae TaxID=706981 RepID=A0A6A5SLC8_9PLEO|nr:hypothetical protein EJ02DRAFT_31955 [Clathrospora elynae]
MVADPIATTDEVREDVDSNKDSDTESHPPLAPSTSFLVYITLFVSQAKVLGPAIYTLLYLTFFGASVLARDVSFPMSLVIIFVIATIADTLRAQKQFYEGELKEIVVLLRLSHKVVGILERSLACADEETQIYKTASEAATKQHKKATDSFTEMESMFIESQNALADAHDKLLIALIKRDDDYKTCRTDTNNTRVKYYIELSTYQTEIIDTLYKLIRKFRNVSVPKVKGVTPNKNHSSHTITAPLEKLTTALRQAQTTTGRYLAIVKAIAIILNIEGLEMEEENEMFEQINLAEKDLVDATIGIVDAEGMGVEVGNRLERRLVGHLKRLNAYVHSLPDRSVVEEAAEE